MIWTAPLLPQTTRFCCPGWALSESPAGLFPSEAMIDWWLWALAEANAQPNMMRFSALHRELRKPLLLPWQPPWISIQEDAHGPGQGSLRHLLRAHFGCERAACTGLCGALPTRLPRRKLVRAEPSPKSGPRFCLPSWYAPCQARGARVAGYPASGPAGAADLALLMLSHTCAKLRGRRFIFLPGVIAALPRCPRHAYHITQAISDTIIGYFIDHSFGIPSTQAGMHSLAACHLRVSIWLLLKSAAHALPQHKGRLCLQQWAPSFAPGLHISSLGARVMARPGRATSRERSRSRDGPSLPGDPRDPRLRLRTYRTRPPSGEPAALVLPSAAGSGSPRPAG